MKPKRTETQEAIIGKLEAAFADNELHDYKILDNMMWGLFGKLDFVDIVIKKGGNPFVFMEVFDNPIDRLYEIERYRVERNKRESKIIRQTTNQRAQFGVLTDNDTYYIYDRHKPKDGFTKGDFELLIKKIKGVKDFKILKSHLKEIVYAFKSAAHHKLNSVVDSKIVNLVESETFINNIEYSDSYNSFFFKDGKRGLDSIENKLFRILLGDLDEVKLCRYTTLETLFAMLSNKSIRMSGLVGMNDKTEVNYADNYLNGKGRKLIDLHHSSVMAINKRYITSCTDIENKDKLTMWRLYADDAQGVCLTFDIKTEKLNSHTLLHKVKYASKYQDHFHNELEFLRSVIDQIKHTIGFNFKFKELKYYKHFFKPHGYSEEDEIRLLIIDNGKLNGNEDWVKTDTHSILNPVIDFPLNGKDFPLKLTEITLGPKCPEMEINKVQIEEMLRRKRAEIKTKKEEDKAKSIDEEDYPDLDGIKVNLSNITDYR